MARTSLWSQTGFRSWSTWPTGRVNEATAKPCRSIERHSPLPRPSPRLLLPRSAVARRSASPSPSPVQPGKHCHGSARGLGFGRPSALPPFASLCRGGVSKLPTSGRTPPLRPRPGTGEGVSVGLQGARGDGEGLGSGTPPPASRSALRISWALQQLQSYAGCARGTGGGGCGRGAGRSCDGRLPVA